MASVGDICYCENCGSKIGNYKANSVGEIRPPDSAETARVFLTVYSFCNKQCKNNWKEARSSSKSNGEGEISENNSQYEHEARMSPEEILAQEEADEMRERAESEERRILDQIEREELEADKAKAKDLKAEGKKWLALWTSIGKTGRLAIGLILGFVWIAGIGKGSILLILIGIIGAVFAGLVIKDTLK